MTAEVQTLNAEVEAGTLYERLGGYNRIKEISEDVWDNHMANSEVSTRYADSDAEEIKKQVTDFVCWGTGGPEKYEGKSMLDAHRTMNINHQEFIAVIDDVMRALEKNNVGQTEQNEMLGLLFSLRDQVINQ